MTHPPKDRASSRGRRHALLIVVCLGSVAGPPCATMGAGTGSAGPGFGPGDATYRIEGHEVHLTDGLAEVQAAPGSATKVRTAVFGEPAHGDLNGDGVDDAALFLVHEPGGSGTFFYVAAALRLNGGYRGTDAVLLGDRVAPQTITVRNGVALANYADRRPDEPMAAAPTVAFTKYLVLRGDALVAVVDLGPGDAVREGWLTIGHEVRSFEPCGEEKALWLSGGAPALADLRHAYHEALPDPEPYAPLFAVVAGRRGERPVDGLGARYDGSFFATRLVHVWQRGNCRAEQIVLDDPAPGQVLTSPLAVRGRARGTWFFEGDFPIELRDARGEVLARHFATARGEWMTREFVPFEGRLEFPKPPSRQRGTLVLRKDNPTGLPALDDASEIPVLFE